MTQGFDVNNLNKYGLGVLTVVTQAATLTHENNVLKRAKWFLSKEIVDTVTLYADSTGLYVMNYDPVRDEWAISDGEIYSTSAIRMEVAKWTQRLS